MWQILLAFGLTGLLRQIRDAITVWLDAWVLTNFKLKCPTCLNKHVWKDGHEKRKNRCAVQRFYCRQCSTSFCVNTLAPWYWHKYDPATVVCFLWIKTKFGYPLIECAKLCCFALRLPTWKTLWSWLTKFGNRFVQKAARVRKKVSRYRAWQTDEMFILNRPVIGTVDPQTSTLLFTPAWRVNEESTSKHLRTVLNHWHTSPRGWWTDEWSSYTPAFNNLPVKVPHGTVCHADEYMSCKGVCTNGIENEWRQFRRWLFRINGIKHQAYVDFYPKLYEAQHNLVRTPLDMLLLLL